MLNIAIHRNMLVSILKDIFTHAAIAPYLGFKGGTVLLLFYDLPRFSVDLDFDLLDASKEDIIFTEMQEILKKFGNVKSQNKRYNLFFLLSYKGKAESAQNIKIEINKRNFGSHYEVKHYLGIPITIMIKEDIVAHKLVAMYERIGTTNRDIFDTWFLLSNHWQVNRQIIEQRTNMTYKKFLESAIAALESVNNRTILSGIGELVNEKQKIWVKTSLKSDTIFLLKLALSHEQ